MRIPSLLGTILVLSIFIGTGLSQTCPEVKDCDVCKNDPSTCTACADHHVLENGACTPCSTGCDACSISNGTVSCTTCYDGNFKATDGTCSKCPQACTTCADANSCSVCADGNRLVPDNEKKCPTCSSGCSECTGATYCTKCGDGYYRLKGSDDTNSCPNCPTGCKTCSDATKPCTCKAGKYWKESIKNCEDCTPTGCSECDVDAATGEVICKECVKDVSTASADGKTCISCTNCVGCQKKGGCTACKAGYHVVDGACIKCNRVDTSSTECDKCLAVDGKGGHYWDSTNTVCKYCGAHCATCDGTGCTACDHGYFTASPSVACQPCDASCRRCSAKTTCTHCHDGKYLNGAACTACHADCLTCDGATVSDCLTCEKGKRYLDGSDNCIACSSTKDSLTLTGTECTNCAPGPVYIRASPCAECRANCKVCVENAALDAKVCKQCITKYYLKADGDCEGCHASCLECDGGNTASQCTKCANRLFNGACLGACGNNEYEKADGSCETCVLGYGTGCATCNAKQCMTCTGGTARHVKEDGSGCVECNAKTETDCKSEVGCLWDMTSTSCKACHADCKACTGTMNDDCSDCYADATKRFLKTSDGTCAGCHSDCKECNGPLNSDCTSCTDDNEYVASTGGSCATCPAECDNMGLSFAGGACDSSGQCTSCEQDVTNDVHKYLVGGVCTACSGNTADFDSLQCNTCILKDNDRYGVYRKTCLPCTPNCDECDSTGKCMAGKCTKKYYRVETAGSTQHTCAYLDCENPQTQNACEVLCVAEDKAPAAGRHWISGTSTCKKCPARCGTCSATACTTCWNGYVLNADTECVSCYLDATPCATCKTATKGRYFITDKAECLPCSANCEECTDANTCTKCVARYWLETSGSSTTCSACDEDVSAAVCGNECKYQIAGEPNRGHYVQSGNNKCKACSTNCKECTNGDTCTICADEFFRDSSVTNKVTCSACSPTCDVCTSVSLCTTCKAGHIPDTATTPTSPCKACDARCKANTCVASGCDCGSEYYYDTTKQSCEKCMTNCDKCTGGTGCNTCNAEYYKATDPNDATIISCAQCGANCKTCKAGTSTGTTECTECLPNYCLSGTGTSTECLDASTTKCKTCAKDGNTGNHYCLTCNSNTVLEVCTGCVATAKCKTCQADNTKCETCGEGYFKNGDVCNQCGNDCDSCTAAGQCDKCEDPDQYFDATANECKNCAKGCVTCETDKKKCTECVSGNLVIDNGDRCDSCPNNCEKCQDSKVCTTCEEGYGLKDSKCKKCTLDGCGKCEYNNGTQECKECADGYYFNATKACLRCDDGFPDCIDCVDVDRNNKIDQNECTKCKGNKIVKDGKACEVCAETGCKTCNDPGHVCTTCSTGKVVTSASGPDPAGFCLKTCQVCTDCANSGNVTKIPCRDSCLYEKTDSGVTRTCGVAWAKVTCDGSCHPQPDDAAGNPSWRCCLGDTDCVDTCGPAKTTATPSGAASIAVTMGLLLAPIVGILLGL